MKLPYLLIPNPASGQGAPVSLFPPRDILRVETTLALFRNRGSRVLSLISSPRCVPYLLTWVLVTLFQWCVILHCAAVA